MQSSEYKLYYPGTTFHSSLAMLSSRWACSHTLMPTKADAIHCVTRLTKLCFRFVLEIETGRGYSDCKKVSEKFVAHSDRQKYEV